MVDSIHLISNSNDGQKHVNEVSMEVIGDAAAGAVAAAASTAVTAAAIAANSEGPWGMS